MNPLRATWTSQDKQANVCIHCGAKAVCVNTDGAVCHAHTRSAMKTRIGHLEAQVAELRKEGEQ